MYARFFTKALHDLGLVGFREPFARLFNQGMIYRFGAKMSKSKGNVVSPDELVARYGADALRLYILFMGPADQDKEWQDTGVDGMWRFLARLWRVVNAQRERSCASAGPAATALLRKTHETINKVSDDIERRFVFNTPVAAVMELVNEISKAPDDPYARDAAEAAVSLVQPYAPHVAEELWSGSVMNACVRALAARRSGASHPRQIELVLPGERQGARPADGPCRARLRGADRARARLTTGAGPSRLRRAARVRRAREARQPRLLNGRARRARGALPAGRPRFRARPSTRGQRTRQRTDPLGEAAGRGNRFAGAPPGSSARYSVTATASAVGASSSWRMSVSVASSRPSRRRPAPRRPTANHS